MGSANPAHTYAKRGHLRNGHNQCYKFKKFLFAQTQKKRTKKKNLYARYIYGAMCAAPTARIYITGCRCDKYIFSYILKNKKKCICHTCNASPAHNALRPY